MKWHTPNNYRVDGDVAYIELVNRYGEKVAETIVSASDVERVIKYGRWRANVRKNGTYVLHSTYYNRKRSAEQLGRFILDAPADMDVDHINRNPLDNRRENIRIVTTSQNTQRAVYRPDNNKTGHRNVHKTRAGRWAAKVVYADKVYWAGTFPTVEEAAIAAKELRRKLHPFAEDID